MPAHGIRASAFFLLMGILLPMALFSVVADGEGALWIGEPEGKGVLDGGINEVRIYRRARQQGRGKPPSEQPDSHSHGARVSELSELFAHYRGFSRGEPQRGRRRPWSPRLLESCGRCHSVHGEGFRSRLNLRWQISTTLPHVLDPDGEIDENYRYFVELTDERVVLG